jgi:hypothetical protein
MDPAKDVTIEFDCVVVVVIGDKVPRKGANAFPPSCFQVLFFNVLFPSEVAILGRLFEQVASGFYLSRQLEVRYNVTAGRTVSPNLGIG